MSTETAEKTEEVVKRVPYAQRLADTLATQKEMRALLESRISMNNLKIDGYNLKFMNANNPASSSSVTAEVSPTWQEMWDVNEAKISNIKTKGELNVLKTVIHEKETYYNNFVQQHEKDWAEVQKRWDITIKIAKTSANKNVQKLMNSIKWDVVEHDEEVKVGVYKALKKYI